VPEPSGFPSGYTLTRSLLELLFGPEIPEANRDKIIATLLPRWPLEALLDEFEFLGFRSLRIAIELFQERQRIRCAECPP
jgi:hypothetical protein